MLRVSKRGRVDRADAGRGVGELTLLYGDMTAITAAIVSAASLIGLFVKSKLASMKLKLAEADLAAANAEHCTAVRMECPFHFAQCNAWKTQICTCVHMIEAHEEHLKLLAVAPASSIAPFCAIAYLVEMIMMSNGEDGVDVAAANALQRLALNSVNQVTIARAGAILHLVDRLGSDWIDAVKESAACVLRNLACNEDNEVEIVRAGAIPPLVALLTGIGTESVKEAAIGALQNLSVSAENTAIIGRAGAIPPLVALLSSEVDAVKEAALLALLNLACNSYNQDVIAIAGGIPRLIALLHVDIGYKINEAAAEALSNLAATAANRVAIVHAGAIAPLLSLVQVNGQDTAAALALDILAYDYEF